MKAIINNVIAGANDVDEALRDGYYTKRPDGRLEVQQTTLVAFLAAQAKLEKLASLIKTALEGGASVVAGDLSAGIFAEFAKKPNWRTEFVSLGGDPKAVNERTAKTESRRVRVYANADEPKGDRLAPTVDGSPVAPLVKAGVEAPE
jgi:hypothetical protein